MARRPSMIVMLVSAVGLCACGSTHFANRPRPALPTNVTVYINNTRVSASPSSVPAGPVIFVVTNQASQAESLQIFSPTGNGQPLADSGPINPQGATNIKVNFGMQGSYTLAAAMTSNSPAQLAAPSSVLPAQIQVIGQAPNSRNVLLSP